MAFSGQIFKGYGLFGTKTEDRTRRTYGLRSALITLVLTSLFVTSALVGLATWDASTSIHDLSTALLESSTKSTVSAIEGKIANRVALLEALAAPSLSRNASDDLIARFNHTSAAGDAHAASLDGAAAVAFLATYHLPVPREEPVVSDLHLTPAAHKPEIAIAIRSPDARAPDRITVMTMPPAQLIQGLAAQAQNHTPLLFTVTDSKGRVMARSRNPEKYVGKQAPNWAALPIIGRSGGTFPAHTAEGAPGVFAFRTLTNTPGWVVVVGEPRAHFNARWQNPANAVLIANALAALFALLAALGLLRLTLKPVEALAAHSQRIARGENARASELQMVTSIREFETLRQSLEGAEQTLSDHANTAKEAMDILAVSERRYRTLAQVGTLVSFESSQQGQLTNVSGWETLTGTPDHDAPQRWWRSVHPQDRPAVLYEINKAVRVSRMASFEFRVRTARMIWRWVRARAAPVRTNDNALVEWVGVLEDVDEQRRAQERISHMAHHDALTGLHNRTYLEERLPELMNQATRGNTGLALHVFDIDRFKEVNDIGGHSAGDCLLVAVARALTAMAGPHLVARLGGDEFVIVQSDVKYAANAQTFSEQVLARLRLIPSTSAASGHVSASLGLARYPCDGHTPKLLLRNADIALCQAKKTGRGEACCFTEKMARDMQERRSLERDLFRAATTRTEELSVVYQPQFRTRDRCLIGYEALARWNHPARGAIPPTTFIPLAEESGLIDTLNDLILREACRNAAHWPAHLTLAVNISVLQFTQTCLPGRVAAILQDTGLPPERLELEVTEGVLIRDRNLALQVLRQLKAMGIRIALDDFGTGYSSLEYLHTFPFHRVKIDQSFIRDLTPGSHADAIVRSIISLGETLRFEVMAEGVETEQQLALLSAYNCDYVQGFLLGEPHKDVLQFAPAIQNCAEHPARAAFPGR